MEICNRCGFDEQIKNSCSCVDVECGNCNKIFNSSQEGSTDNPDLCDSCWVKKQENKTEFLEFLENLVMHRFDKVEEIENKIKEKFNLSECSIERKTKYDEENHLDYNLIGNINKELLFCDFDIYYLKDNGGKLFITEVGYEFE